MVASLVRLGGNARYTEIAPERLVRVPKDLDPAIAVCVIETHLSAFQILHTGQDPTGNRYQKYALEGKSILLYGGMSLLGKTMIELALLAGALNVYVPAKAKHHELLFSLGATPLDNAEWIPHLEGQMDIVVDSYVAEHYYQATKALKKSGKVICTGMRTVPRTDSSWTKHAEQWVERMKPKMSKQTHFYDIFQSWEENFEMCNVSKHSIYSIRLLLLWMGRDVYDGTIIFLHYSARLF
jgi:NADPH:quinone reductase-like Zn-dependent oxidoreductase